MVPEGGDGAGVIHGNGVTAAADVPQICVRSSEQGRSRLPKRNDRRVAGAGEVLPPPRIEVGDQRRHVVRSGRRVVDSLYEKLEQEVIPLFYHDRARFLQVMAHAIALNGSFFNTHRMLQQYVLKAYF